jgi:hypothetical protein
MHGGEDPVASAASARKLVDCLVAEAWPEGHPSGQAPRHPISAVDESVSSDGSLLHEESV